MVYDASVVDETTAEADHTTRSWPGLARNRGTFSSRQRLSHFVLGYEQLVCSINIARAAMVLSFVGMVSGRGKTDSIELFAEAVRTGELLTYT